MISKIHVPNYKPVTLAQAKTYLRKESTDDQDTIIAFALNSAVDYIERRTKRALTRTTFLQIVDDGWPWERCILLGRRPVVSIEEVKYQDSDGAWQTVDVANYELRKSGNGRGDVVFLDGYSFPSLLFNPGPSITVEFVAGYDDPNATGSDDPELALPDKVKIAVLMLTAHWYDNRGVIRSGDNMQRIELAADAMIEQLEVFR